MNNEQLEAKLEQALTKRNAISEDISSLKENGTKADKEILRLYADLAALDEPVVRHGDVYSAYGDGGEPSIIIGNGRHAKAFQSNGKEVAIWPDGRYRNSSPIFNAIDTFDDLKAISESLEEFEAESRYDKNKLSVHIYGGRDICIINGPVDTILSPSQFHDFNQKCHRMEATLKNKETG